MTYLEYAGSVRCPPGVQQVVFASAHEPFTYRRKHIQPSTDKASGEERSQRGRAALVQKRGGEKGEAVSE